MKKILLASTAIASAMIAGQANADTFSQTATIDVLDALAVTEVEQMDFGKIGTPSGDVVVHLTAAGGNGGSTTATMVDTSSMAAGEYKITGSSTNTISIQVTDAGSVAGFEFTEFSGSYDSGGALDFITERTGQAAPGGGAGKTLVLGAKLAVADAVTNGTYAPDFDIDINYE